MAVATAPEVETGHHIYPIVPSLSIVESDKGRDLFPWISRLNENKQGDKNVNVGSNARIKMRKT